MPGGYRFTFQFEIAGGAAVADNGTIIACIFSCTNGGIDTHMGHHAANYQMGHVERLQSLFQRGRFKTVRKVFGDYRFVFTGLMSR